jgi:hypothetical protein
LNEVKIEACADILIAHPKAGVLQLFDLQNDPNELTNLIDRPDHAARQSVYSSS